MKHLNKISLLIISLAVAGCSDHEIGPPDHGQVGVAVAPQSIAGNSMSNAGPTTSVSGGPNTLGVLIPTGPGAVSRIQNGLEMNVNPAKGNFRKSIAQVSTNLPNTTSVMLASGFDQIELLAYSACADLTTGTTPLMQSKYNILPAASVTTNQAALIAAGIRILDQHTASLASQGPDAAAVSTVFTNLVQLEASDATNTSTIAFMTVCIAANTAGSTMLGL